MKTNFANKKTILTLIVLVLLVYCVVLSGLMGAQQFIAQAAEAEQSAVALQETQKLIYAEAEKKYKTEVLGETVEVETVEEPVAEEPVEEPAEEVVEELPVEEEIVEEPIEEPVVEEPVVEEPVIETEQEQQAFSATYDVAVVSAIAGEYDIMPLATGNRYCSNCARSTSHTYTAINNSSHTVKCNICGTSSTLSHTFGSYNNFATAPSTGVHYRYRECSGCALTDTDSHSPVSASTWNPEAAGCAGSCGYSGCGQKVTKSHDSSGSWTGNTDGTHYLHCKDCGLQLGMHQPIYASWSNHSSTCAGASNCAIKSTHSASWGSWSNHARSCTKCSATQNHSSNIPWSGWTNHSRSCNTCGKVDSHTASFGNWYDNGANHRQDCSQCDAYNTAGHGYGGYTGWSGHSRSRTCGTCYHVDVDSHANNIPWSNFTNYDATYHIRTCSSCGVNDFAGHGYGAYTGANIIGSSQHYQYCTTSTCNRLLNQHTAVASKSYKSRTGDNVYHYGPCGSCNVEVRADHTDPGAFTGTGTATEHYKLCTTAGCGYKYSYHTAAASSYTYLNTTYHDGNCRTCGNYITFAHTWSLFSGNTDLGQTHTRTCGVGCKNGVETHPAANSANWTNTGDYTYHYGKCGHSLCTITVRQPHTDPGPYSAGSSGVWSTEHYKICTTTSCALKYTSHTPSCTWEYGMANATTHSGHCSTVANCNLVITRNHDYDTSTWAQDSGFHYHPCRAATCTWNQNSRQAHRCPYYWSYNPANPSMHRGYCDLCGNFYAEAPHTVDYNTLQYDMSGHWYSCTGCAGAQANFVQHDWENLPYLYGSGRHYKQCPTCKQIYLNDNHNLVYIEAVAPVCNKPGHVEYWACKACDTYYSDSAGTKMVASSAKALDGWVSGSGAVVDANAHDWSQWTSNGNNTHSRTCRLCNKVETVDCSTVTNVYYNDNNNHWQICDVCHQSFGVKQHTQWTTWVMDDATEMHTRRCVTCDYIDSHTPKIPTTWTTKTIEKHEGKCCYDGCTIDITVKHDDSSWIWVVEDGIHTKICSVCEVEFEAGHEAVQPKTWTEFSVETHGGACGYPGCGAISSYAHTWTDWSVNGTGEHVRDCYVCMWKDRHNPQPANGWNKGDDKYTHSSECQHEGCTLSMTQNHVWATGWYIDGDNHLVQHARICLVCDYKDTHEAIWRKFTPVEGGLQHTSVCLYEGCGVEIVENHFDWTDWNIKPNGNHYRICNDCFYTSEHAPALPEEGWQHRGNGHYATCAHGDDCDIEVFEQHNELSWTEWSSNSIDHSRTCLKCEAVDSHRATGKWITNAETKHERTCDVCKTVDEHDAEWNYKNSGDYYHLATCEHCDIFEFIEHEWTEWAESEENANLHVRNCEVCDATAEHKAQWTYVSNGEEDHTKSCGYGDCKLTATESHNWKEQYVDAGDGQHYKECADCGQKIYHDAQMPSTWTGKDADNHYAQCEEEGCNVTMSQAHSFGEWTIAEDGKHVRTCEADGCGATVEHEAQWTLKNLGEQGHQEVCEVCEQTGETYDHTNFSKWATHYTTGSHYRTCEDCGYVEEHDPVTEGVEWEENEATGNHQGTCGHEDCDQIVTGTHNWSTWTRDDENNNHKRTCNDCGAEQTGAHSYKYTKNGENHIVTCKYCDYEVEAEHQVGGWTRDSENHWKACEFCGEKTELGTHSYNQDGRYCDTCGYDYLSDGQLDGYKENAKNVVNSTAEGAKNIVNSRYGKGELTEEQAQMLKDAIDAEAARACEKIDAQTNLMDVIAVQTDATSTITRIANTQIDSLDLESAKNDAKARIEDAVAAAKKIVDTMGGLTDKQKQERYAAIDAAARDAFAAIDACETEEQIAEELAKGREAVYEAAGLNPEQVAKEVEKEITIDDIRAKAEAAKKEVDDMNLSEKTKKAYKDAIDAAAEEAIRKIREEYPDYDYVDGNSVAGYYEEYSAAKASKALAAAKKANKTKSNDVEEIYVNGVVVYGFDGGFGDDLNEQMKLYYAVHSANEAIDEATQRAIQMLDMLGLDKTSQEYADRLTAIQKAADAAKEAIEESTNLDEVKANLQEGRESVYNEVKASAGDEPAVDPKVEADRDAAIDAVEQAAQDARDAIEGMEGLTEEQRQEFLDKIDEIEQKAKEDIEGATSSEEIGGIEGQFEKDIEATEELAQAKSDANEELKGLAEQKKQDIENRKDLTGNEQDSLKDLVDQELERALEAVDNAETVKEVEKAVDNAKSNMDDIASATPNEGVKLQEKKEQAKDNIDRLAEEAKKAIDDRTDLYPEEKERLKGLIDDEVTRAYAEIDKATSSDEVDEAVKAAKSAMDDIAGLPGQSGGKPVDPVNPEPPYNPGGSEEIDFAETQNKAKKDLEDKAYDFKKEIDGREDLYNDEKEDLKNQIDEELKKAYDAIDNASSKGEIDEIVDDTIASMEEIKDRTGASEGKKVEDPTQPVPSNPNSEIEVEKAKKQAQEDLNKAAQKAKDEIQERDDLDQSAKDYLKGLVDEVLKNALEEVNGSSNVDEIRGIVEKAEADMEEIVNSNGVDLKEKKADAIKDLEEYAEQLKKGLEGDPDAEQKGNLIDEELERAKKAIEEATTAKEVEKAVDNAMENMDRIANSSNVDLETEKSEAKGALEKEAERLKGEVDNRDLTPDQKQALKDLIDDELARAKDAVDNAETKEELDQVVADAKAEMERLSKTEVKDMGLENARNEAKKELEDLAYDLKKGIDERNDLYDSEKETLKDLIDEELNRGYDALDDATTLKEIQKAKENAEANMNRIADANGVTDGEEIVPGKPGQPEEPSVPGKGDSEVDLEYNKSEEKKNLDDYAEAKKKAIDARKDLTTEEKETLKDLIDDELVRAKAAVDKAESQKELDKVVEDAKANMDRIAEAEGQSKGETTPYPDDPTNPDNPGHDNDDVTDVDLEEARNEAKKGLEDEAYDAKKSIDARTDLTDDEKELLKDLIDKELARAYDDIDNADNQTEIDMAVEQAEANFDRIANVQPKKSGSDDIELEQKRNEAKDDLKDIADGLKDEIDERVKKGQLSKEEGETLKGLIDDELFRAYDEIDGATSKDEIDGIVSDATAEMERLSKTESKDVALEEARSQAKKDLESSAFEKKNEIDERKDLTDAEKKILKDAIDDELNRAMDALDDAKTIEEIEKIVENAKDNMSDIATAEGKTPKGEEADPDEPYNPDPENPTDVDFEKAKNDAKNELTEYAEAKKAEIDERVEKGEITAEQAKDLKALIDDELRRAYDIIDGADSLDDISVAVSKSKADMDRIAKTAAKDVELENKKNEAKKDLADYAEQLKDEIDKRNDLTDAEKEILKGIIENERDRAYDAVDKATSEDEIKAAVEESKEKMGRIADAEGKTPKGEDVTDPSAPYEPNPDDPTDLDMEKARDKAKKELEKVAEEKKAEIDDRKDLTDAEKDILKGIVDNERDRAYDAIDDAQTQQEIDDIVKKAESNMGRIADAEGKTPKGEPANPSDPYEPNPEDPTDVDLEVKKDEAKKELEKHAEDTKKAIDGLLISEEEKAKRKELVDSELDRALDAIDSARSIEKVEEVLNSAKAAMDRLAKEDSNVELEQAKDQAKNDVTNKANQLLDDVRKSDLPEDLKQELIDRIEKELSDALEAIENAENLDDVENAKNNGLAALEQAEEDFNETLELEHAKRKARDELTNQANQLIEDVNGSDLSDELKKGIIDSIEEELSKALEEIDNAKTVEDVEAAQKAGNRALVDAERNFKELKDAKDEAREALEEQAKELEKDIKLRNDLTEEEKQEIIDRIEKELADALEAVDNAKTVEEVEEARKSGSEAIKDAELNIAKEKGAEEVENKGEQAKDEIGKVIEDAQKRLDEVKDELKEIEEKLGNPDSLTPEEKKELEQKRFDLEKEQKDLEKELEDLQKALDEIEQNVKDALDKIDSAETPDDVKKAVDEAEKAIGGIVDDVDEKYGNHGGEKEDPENPGQTIPDKSLKEEKQDAYDELDKVAQAKKDEIDARDDLTEEEKQEIKDRIDQEVEKAKGEIEKAVNSDEIENALQDGLDAIEDAELNVAKDNAKKELDDKAQQAKDVIDSMPGLSDEEKEQAKKEVDDALIEAKKDVNGATNKDEVQDAVDQGVAGIVDAVDKADELAGGTLKNAKDGANKELDDAYNAAKDIIDSNPDLSDEEKQEYQDQLDKEYKEAKKNVAQAMTPDQAATAAEEGINNMEELVKDLIVQPEPALELGVAVVSLTAQALILLAGFFIVHRRTK